MSIRLMWQEPRDHRKRVLAESQRQARPADHLGSGSPCQNKWLPHCSLLSRSLAEREQMASLCLETPDRQCFHVPYASSQANKHNNLHSKRQTVFLVDLFNAHLYPLNSTLLMNIKASK